MFGVRHNIREFLLFEQVRNLVFAKLFLDTSGRVIEIIGNSFYPSSNDSTIRNVAKIATELSP